MGTQRVHGSQFQPKGWRIDELNRLLASARAMPGTVGDVPAGLWWSALLLCILDTGISVERLLAAPREAYDQKRGVLTSGSVTYELHAVTVDAITQVLRWPAERLLAWPLDGASPPFHMLLRYIRELLFRVGLPAVKANLFRRLLITNRESPNALDHIDLTIVIRPRSQKPRYPRTRKPEPRSLRTQKTLVTPVPSDQSLQRFFIEMYVPLKLTGGAASTAEDYQSTLNKIAAWCGHEPSLELLTDNSVDAFLAWCLNTQHLAPGTVNKYRRNLLAIWRYAYRKRLVKEDPRDVTRIREGKPNPEAWTITEVGQIVAATKTLTGNIGGVPKGDWFAAFVLVLYYTGLRVKALRAVRRETYDPATGWLAVPEDVQKHRVGQVFQLPADARDAVESVIDASPLCELLFPPIGCKRDLYMPYREVLLAAGLRNSRKDSFHRLRRTCATFIYDKLGIDAAKEYLGHSHSNVTRRYIDRRQLNQVQPTNVLPTPVQPIRLLPRPESMPDGAA